MPEFFLELFSEEIPARMQAAAAEELARICNAVFAELSPAKLETFFGPRRIALAAQVATEKPGSVFEARGPRDTAPEAALAGFLGKYKAKREDVVAEGGYYLLRRDEPAIPAADLIASALPAALAKFSWPKSMRWGQSGDFAWVRPLRRIVCLLDGKVIPITLGPVAASNLSEGHRFLSSGTLEVSSVEGWKAELGARKVIADQAERRRLIIDGLNATAAERGLTVAEDNGLIDEVTGLVEWPVPLLGRIDEDFMDLPPEVRELSMKVNQRYFALRDAAGKPAPYFAFVSNLAATDGGRAIIAGNERVLRARLSDARHFWDMDIQSKLDTRLPKLENIVFHALLGSQRRRVERLVNLSSVLTHELAQYNESFAEPTALQDCRRAALLSKCDLTSGLVGEFPELQGVIGGYYAEHDGEPPAVCQAISDQYRPRGPADDVPIAKISIILSLADKIDTLASFFSVGLEPTSSQDPFALRRACLGVIRILVENGLHARLRTIYGFAISQILTQIYYDLQGSKMEAAEALKNKGVPHNWVEELSSRIGRSVKAFNAETLLEEADRGSSWHYAPVVNEVRRKLLEFTLERLKVKLRTDGRRFDVLDAVLAKAEGDDLVQILERVSALERLLGTADGVNLITAYRRAANILRIENAKDGPHEANSIDEALPTFEEAVFRSTLIKTKANTKRSLEIRDYDEAVSELAALRHPVDAFFDRVTINDPDPDIRRNRLALLALLRDTMHQIADFSKIEG